jgi:hypothetical protein
MSDLSSLMQIAPTVGAGFIGRNQALEEDTTRLKQQELADIIAQRAAEAQQKSQMNPLMMEHQRLVNQGLEAGLPGLLAESRSKGYKADKEAATMDSDIQAVNAANADKIDEDKVKKVDRMRKFFTESSQVLKDTPVPARAAQMQNLMVGSGLDPNHPMAQALMGKLQANPDNFPEVMAQLNDRLGDLAAKANPATNASMRNMDVQRASAEKVAAGNNATSLEVARINAAARENAASSRRGGAGGADFWASFYKLKSSKDKHAALILEATKVEKDDPITAAKMFDMAEAIEPQAKAEINSPKAGTPDIAATTKGRVAVNPGPDIAPKKKETTSPKSPEISSVNDLQKMYPGVPADKLREAYKKKFGVDLK